jgi:hypothetical protein
MGRGGVGAGDGAQGTEEANRQRLEHLEKDLSDGEPVEVGRDDLLQRQDHLELVGL